VSYSPEIEPEYEEEDARPEYRPDEIEQRDLAALPGSEGAEGDPDDLDEDEREDDPGNRGQHDAVGSA